MTTSLEVNILLSPCNFRNQELSKAILANPVDESGTRTRRLCAWAVATEESKFVVTTLKYMSVRRAI